MKKFPLFALLLLVSSAYADVQPVQYYDTIEEAATHGLQSVIIKPTASYYEWGGALIRNRDGKFGALPAATNHAGDHVRIDTDEVEPLLALAGAAIVGTYHTHPCLAGYNVEYFSPPDLVEAIFWRRVVFMGDLCTGKVHEFKPGDKPDVERPEGDNNGFWLTKGRVVGQFAGSRPPVVE